MAAFLIVQARVHDATAFSAYVEAVQPVIAQWGGRLIARGNPPVVLEGDWPWQTVGVLEFPSLEAIEEFWASKEYGAVKELRLGASDFLVVAANAA